MNRTTRFILLTVTGFFNLSLTINAQNLEVDGKVKITDMDTAAASAQNVGRESDGTLALMPMSATTYSIGDFAHGGVVFWVTPSGEHGRVVNLYNVADVEWSNVTTEIGGSAQSNINGAGNSIAIISQSGHLSSAAKHCLDLAFGDFDDWYLPSKDEVNLLYTNRNVINTTATANGGEAFVATGYWSSTENDASTDEAWNQSFFGSGNQQADPKSVTFHFRAIRAF